MSELTVAHPKLTTDEARALTEDIRSGVVGLHRKILAAHRGEVWTALGYASFREWSAREYDLAQSHIYHLLNYARVEEALSENAETGVSTNVEKLNVSQARLMASLPDDQKREAFALAQQTAAATGKPVTAKVVKASVVKIRAKRNGAAPEPPPHAPGTISDAELDAGDLGDPVKRTALAFRECDEAQQLKAGGGLIDEMKGQSFVRITLLFLSAMNPEQVFEVCARSGLSLPK